MIIDGHAYCFPARDKAAGYPSVDERWHEFQRELSGHHQPVWRVRDRAPADSSTLIDPETKEFHDVEFAVHRNRFTWDYEGETYTKQYYPPMLYRGDAPAELLITEMDYAGIDMALLHTSPQLGRLNDYLADAVSQYPDRLRWLVNIPEPTSGTIPTALLPKRVDGWGRTAQPHTSFIPSSTTSVVIRSRGTASRCAHSGTA